MKTGIPGMTPGAFARICDDLGALATQGRTIRETIFDESERDELRDLALLAEHGPDWLEALQIARAPIIVRSKKRRRPTPPDPEAEKAVAALAHVDRELRRDGTLRRWMAAQTAKRERQLAPLDPVSVASVLGPRAPVQPSRFPANHKRRGLVAGAAVRALASVGGRPRARLSGKR